MESLLWGAASLVILVPVIYFLPLGITKKGKLIVILTAFFVALLGQVASMIIALSQVFLILFLLVLLFSYILDQRMASLMFGKETASVKKKESEEFYYGSSSVNLEPTVSLQESFDEIESDITPLDEALLVSEKPVAPITSSSGDMVSADIELEDDISFLLTREMEQEIHDESQGYEDHNRSSEYIEEIEDIFTDLQVNNVTDESFEEVAHESLQELEVLSFDKEIELKFVNPIQAAINEAAASNEGASEIEEIDWEMLETIQGTDKEK
ncbi:hypothetical protein RCG23_18175 [Neobacillus sp. PS3-34]|uniref:hypothetical protein n=1 Tax=Neobacillus sp. PS3-34 TaxID=3070678 RepID=UPI0027DF8E45|nr:hypothetical protein [Neobacillus sp. PS3-34]WML47372.1 hypothetical protein RCG23_18175 [Neobacillus sp. PS3-34]